MFLCRAFGSRDRRIATGRASGWRTYVVPVAALVLGYIWLGSAAANVPPLRADVDAVTTAKVESLLRQMTIEEKIGQMSQLDYREHGSDERVRRGEVGAYLNLTDPAEINRVQRIAVEQSRLHIPLLLGFDVINGYRTLFPISLAQAATWDPSLVERAHAVIAQETAAVGLNWTFAPMLDIARDPRWGRIVEGSGEDPWLGSAMARAKILGLQGPRLGTPGRILACMKHFAGYGAPPGGRDYDSVYLPEVQLQNVYLPPFRAAEEAGVGSVMSAYMDLNDVPATGNAPLLRGVLRGEWGFRGFVVSDSWAVHSLHNHEFADSLNDAALRAFRAGVNMDMGSDAYFKYLAANVRSGAISETSLDDAVRPILRTKYQLALFTNPYVDATKTEAVLTDPEHRSLAKQVAVETAVLLRNQDSTLPIKPTVHSIAVVGSLADDAKALLGSWPAKSKTGETVTLLAGIRRRASSSVRVTYEPGVVLKRLPQAELNPDTMDADAGPDPLIERAVAASRAADMTVLVLGEDASMNGEYGSRASIDLPGKELQLMQAVAAASRASAKPVVLVLVNGRPLNITWASTHIPSILETWQSGTTGGDAVAALLFGDAVPGGKLPITWPRSTGQIPIFYAHNHTQIDQEAKNFQSFYWDEPTSPLYPFGFGLSYSTFSISDLKLSRTDMGETEALEAVAQVKNTGAVAADEVVQLYVHQQAGSASRPVRQLKGFERVHLNVGETRTVRFTIGPKELRFWTPARKEWVVEPGKFDVWIGDSSLASLHAEFAVTPTTEQQASHVGISR